MVTVELRNVDCLESELGLSSVLGGRVPRICTWYEMDCLAELLEGRMGTA